MHGRPPLLPSRRAGSAPQRPGRRADPVGPLERVLRGAACYLLGLVSGAVVIPWLVDRSLSRFAGMTGE